VNDLRQPTDIQKAGQRLMIGFDGMVLDDRLRYAIDTLKVGGLILFACNIEAPAQLADLCGSAQTYAAKCGQPPLFIAIDQEGGRVARLKPPFTQFGGNPFMHSLQDAIDFACITADELRRTGINMNMAPVLDVLPATGESVMSDRAFGSDPDWVARMGCTVIEHLQRNGIMAVAKHFPGIGRTVLDSHADLPDLDIAPRELAGRDLIPFQAAITAGVSGMMLSHIRYLRHDPVWPASLSPILTENLLRQQLGYDGLVITDDLDMGAVAKNYDIVAAVRQCLRAGVDIVLICHAGPSIQLAWNEILRLNRDSDDLALNGTQSLRRIAALKKIYLKVAE
jgi:beta-N-acetylhexosaminidase